jgi:lysophospholipase L1-like esterase
MKTLLSLGDCNTRGFKETYTNAYPEKLAKMLNLNVINCGCTMSTTREGVRFFDDSFDSNISLITIQYGLVDSWKTFRFAPYSLYYPDTFWRKIIRKFIKKIKKIGRFLKLKRWLGEVSVVSINEYKTNIRSIIETATNTPIILIETFPNHDAARNTAIKEYNKSLHAIAANYSNVKVISVYSHFLKHLDSYYFDQTHINSSGHSFVAKELKNVYESVFRAKYDIKNTLQGVNL